MRNIIDHIPNYGVTKAEHDKWALEHDRAFTDAEVVMPHLKGYAEGGKVRPKQNGLNQIDPVASRLRGAGSAQR